MYFYIHLLQLAHFTQQTAPTLHRMMKQQRKSPRSASTEPRIIKSERRSFTERSSTGRKSPLSKTKTRHQREHPSRKQRDQDAAGTFYAPQQQMRNYARSLFVSFHVSHLWIVIKCVKIHLMQSPKTSNILNHLWKVFRPFPVSELTLNSAQNNKHSSGTSRHERFKLRQHLHFQSYKVTNEQESGICV